MAEQNPQSPMQAGAAAPARAQLDPGESDNLLVNASANANKDGSTSSPQLNKLLERFSGILAVAALVLGNIKKIVDALKTILDEIGIQIQPVVVNTLPRGILLGSIVLGYLILLWLLRRRARHSLHRKALVAGAIVCVCALGANAWSLFRERLTNKEIDKIQAVWSERLLSVQLRDSKGNYNGFRYTLTPDPQGYPDAWSTAQAIRALVMSNTNLKLIGGRLQQAFASILSDRVQSNQSAQRVGIGWVTIPDAHTKTPQKITRTEISGWVTLAYAAALKSHAVWENDDQRGKALKTLDDLSSDLVARQEAIGAWSASYKPVSPDAQRVYSSAIALWALVEARRLLGPSSLPAIDRSIQTGAEWLINAYRPDRGWDPEATPNNTADVYPGLTAEVLFILKLATDSHAAENLEGNGKYRTARKQFADILTLSNKTPSKVSVVHETARTQKQKDQNLYGEDLNVHFAEYPWALAALEVLRHDPSLSGGDRRAAANLEDDYLQQLDDVEMTLSSGPAFILAEHLIGLTYVEAMRFPASDLPFEVPKIPREDKK